MAEHPHTCYYVLHVPEHLGVPKSLDLRKLPLEPLSQLRASTRPALAWVAVKELELSYHNGCAYMYTS